MVIPSQSFLAIASEAIRSGTEVTLSELIVALGLPDTLHVLEQVNAVQETLAGCNLELFPSLARGGLDTTRVLRSSVAPIIDAEYALREIADGETTTREFKSSLIYDHKKATANPGMLTHDLKSDEVTHSCLKTMAAFLTTAGGVLYAGINDTGECVGIEFDFHFLKQGWRSKDGWELHLRNLITGRFKDGDSINDYVSFAFVEIGKLKTAARISVQRRRILSFVMKNDAFTLYRRQGNRTVEVGIEELEEFIEFRRIQEWA